MSTQAGGSPGRIHATSRPGETLETSPAPSPSKLAPSSGNEDHRWHELATGTLGAVNFSELFKAEYSFAYAMTIVYSDQLRDVAMLIGTDDSAIIWNNGKQVFLSPRYAPADSLAVLMTLQPGRNTILAKVTNDRGPHSLNLRFGTGPAEAARAFAAAKKWNEAADEFAKAFTLDPTCQDSAVLGPFRESLIQLGRWKDARPVLEKMAALDPENFDKQTELMKCYLALKDYASYRRVCEAGIARYGKSQAPNAANNAIWHAALIPNAVHNYSDVIEIGRKLRRLANGHRQRLEHVRRHSLPRRQVPELADVSQKVDRLPEREGKRVRLGLHGDGSPPVEAARRPGSPDPSPRARRRFRAVMAKSHRAGRPARRGRTRAQAPHPALNGLRSPLLLSRLRSMILPPVLLRFRQTNRPQVLNLEVQPLIVKRLVAGYDSLKCPDHAEEKPQRHRLDDLAKNPGSRFPAGRLRNPARSRT